VELREASVEEQLDGLRRRTAEVGVFHLDPDVDLDAADLVVAMVASAPHFMCRVVTVGGGEDDSVARRACR
jgi:hypothetical protein